MFLEDQEHQEEYARLVKAFNNDPRPGKRPQDFLAMFFETDTPTRKRLMREAKAALPEFNIGTPDQVKRS